MREGGRTGGPPFMRRNGQKDKKKVVGSLTGWSDSRVGTPIFGRRRWDACRRAAPRLDV